jgi:predicted nucleotidyltransferase
VLRKGARHDETGCAEGFPSAAQIRSLILQDNPQGKKSLPSFSFEILRREITAGRAPVSYSAMETAILSHLRRLSPADLALLPDISEGLEYRLYEGIRSACSLGSLFSCVKTKRYTHARIRRLTLHAFLGVTQGDTALSPPYLHVLGFNDRGQEVLRRMRDTAKKPVLMRASGLRTLSPAAQTIYRLNACATDLFALAMPQKQPCGMEQTKNVVRLSSTG